MFFVVSFIHSFAVVACGKNLKEMVAVFKSFVLIIFAVFLLFDSAFCSCELTSELEAKDVETGGYVIRYVEYQSFAAATDINRAKALGPEMDKINRIFELRREKGYYPKNATFDKPRVQYELLMGHELHKFEGQVLCQNGHTIHESKARVLLLDYNLKEHERECHSLHDKAAYHRKKASFDFFAFITKDDNSLVKYRFYDVCYNGQVVEMDAFVDGSGHYVL